MNVYFVLALCFIPYVLMFVISRFFCKVKISTCLIASLLGLLSVVPIVFLQYIFADVFQVERKIELGAFFTLFLTCLLYNGLVEEGIKMLCLVGIPVKKLQLKDFFVATLLFGMILGCFESATYFLQHLQKTNSRGGQLLYNILFLRMFSSDLIHMFCAGLSGLFVWGLKNKKIYVMPLVYAIFIHGIFNFFNYFNGGIQFFSYVAILFAVIECRVKYVKFATEAEDSKTLTDATEISAKTKKSTKENSAKKTKKTQSKVNEKD